MHTLIVRLAAGALLTGAPLALPAQQDTPTPKVEKKVTRTVAVTNDGAPVKKESKTFLGVETAPVGETLAAQLDLPEGTGLVVRTVVPNSPAANHLQTHDILLKLDDQVLIEVRQLAVLISSHQPGDEVTLKFMRKGKEETARVKLAQKETPRREIRKLPGVEGGAIVPLPRLREGARLSGQSKMGQQAPHTQEMLSALDALRAQGPHVRVTQRSGQSAQSDRDLDLMIVKGTSGNLCFSDDAGTLEVTVNEGKKSLLARDKAGQVIFNGPIDTDEQRVKVPAALKPRLEQVETMEGFSFTSDDDIRERHLRVITPERTRISAPLPPGAPVPPIPAIAPLVPESPWLDFSAPSPVI